MLNEIIHVPARLKIMTYLVDNEEATFKELQERLGLTQGNLSSHLQKLENAGYVKIIKRFQGRKPLTKVRITQKGIREYNKYVEELLKIINRGR